jgi:hypothetical protein
MVELLIDCRDFFATTEILMFITQFFSESDGKVVYSRPQASDFAKKIADDFNPLHDIDAKRFCVPGDLLFATTLAKSGLHQQMSFNFSGMVSDNIALSFPNAINEQASIFDNSEKEYLSVHASGNLSQDSEQIESLVKSYVGFSGRTFPHVLVPLMAQKNVMINPARPMIIYESMGFELDHLNWQQVDLSLKDSSLVVDEKRGNARLEFEIKSAGEVIGRGLKHMVLSGLRPYDNAVMDAVVNDYISWKEAFYQSV